MLEDRIHSVELNDSASAVELNNTKTINKNPTYITPQALAVLATYRCTAACEHCCFDSNPDIKHRLDLESILKTIEDAAEFPSLRLVSFTGGECFLLGEDLNTAVKFSVDKGLRVRCVTNGFWAKKYSAGMTRLKRLKEDGLSEISISTGDFHVEYVDIETVVNAIAISLELGLKTDVSVELTKNRKVTYDDFSSHPRLKSLIKEKKDIFQMYESPWMPMDHEEVIDQSDQLMLNRDNVSNFKGCDSVLTTLALTPYNRIGYCCGLSRELIPELTVDSGDLTQIVKTAGDDFMKIWLSVEGPERILAWAGSIDPSIDWENKYAHRCQACLALYKDEKVIKVIRENYKDRMDDVLFRHGMNLQKQELLNATVYA